MGSNRHRPAIRWGYAMSIVVLEGVNGSGKSCCAEFIQRTLRAAGRSCLVADPTGFGIIGQLLRRHIVDPNFATNPDLDAVLFTALRIDGARQMLQLIEADPETTIVLERWSLALLAYGAADGARLSLISELRSVLRNVLTADMTIVLNVNGERAFERLRKRNDRNRFELRGAVYLDDVARLYRYYGEREDRTVIVDASGDLEKVCERAAFHLALT